MAQPNIALLGCGQWGRNLARNLAGLAVLDDQGFDAVVIATPAALHFEMARRALESGKDVFVEKPLALTVKEGEVLVETADRAGRILMVGHSLEYHPAAEK